MRRTQRLGAWAWGASAWAEWEWEASASVASARAGWARAGWAWVEWAKGESARVAAEELAQCRYTNILDGRRRGKDPSAVPCRSPRAQSSPLL